MKNVCVLLLLIILAIEIQAQKKINPSEIFKEGYDNLLSNDYPEALFSFDLLALNGYGNANIYYLTGICYLNTPGLERKAINSLEKAIIDISETYMEGSFDETSAPLQTYYYLAQCYRIAGDYTKAKQLLVTLLDRIDTLKDKNTLALINHEINYGKNAETLMKFANKLEIQNVGNTINSSLNELNPSVTSDESSMYFMVNKKFYDAIYYSNKVNGEWSEKEEITNRLGSDGEFIELSISADGTKMLLYSYSMYSNGDIYESKLSGNKWSKCKKLNKNINSAYSENFASYSPDGKTIYFASNRPGGMGGYDIYKSDLGADGDWSEAINLGPNINTSFDEATPIVSPDGNYLYFSSKGHFSMGGFDIFRSKIVRDQFLFARNVGYPLNSSGDNLYWVPINDGLTGYIPEIGTNGFGGYDIYKIHFNELPNLPRFIISGSVKSGDNLVNSSSGLNICLENLETKAIECLNQFEAGKSSFKFEIPAGHYHLNLKAQGYKDLMEDIILDPEQLESVLHFDLALEKIIIPKKLRSFNVRSIFFSFDSWEIQKEYYHLLDSVASLLSEFPSLQLDISGFTDGIGKSRYNQHLSLRRSQSIMSYIGNKSISPGRLHCHGNGNSNHIALEKTKNGKDLAAGRYWNRRVEFGFSATDSVNINFMVPPVPKELRIDK